MSIHLFFNIVTAFINMLSGMKILRLVVVGRKMSLAYLCVLFRHY